ncbi:unnamed protein product [Symbiodinium sp. CCMP2592]|nr:unnamed protein product [Symbiodinium sp. CCMP2592]
MKVAAEAFKNLRVVSVTEDENGLSDETIAVLRCFIVHMVEEFNSLHWGKLWKNLNILIAPVESVALELQPYFAVEWPKTCQYWNWKDVKKTLNSRQREVSSSLVDGCAVGMVGSDGHLVHKRWRIDCDYETSVLCFNFNCSRSRVATASRRVLARVFLTFCAFPMDELLWLLVAVMAASAAVSSYLTWLVTLCVVVPRRTAKARVPVVAEDSESEGELPTELPTSPPSTTLSVESKFYVSSVGKTLHLFPSCPGRNARLKTYRVCINCINRLTVSKFSAEACYAIASAVARSRLDYVAAVLETYPAVLHDTWPPGGTTSVATWLAAQHLAYLLLCIDCVTHLPGSASPVDLLAGVLLDGSVTSLQVLAAADIRIDLRALATQYLAAAPTLPRRSVMRLLGHLRAYLGTFSDVEADRLLTALCATDSVSLRIGMVFSCWSLGYRGDWLFTLLCCNGLGGASFEATASRKRDLRTRAMEYPGGHFSVEVHEDAVQICRDALRGVAGWADVPLRLTGPALSPWTAEREHTSECRYAGVLALLAILDSPLSPPLQDGIWDHAIAALCEQHWQGVILLLAMLQDHDLVLLLLANGACANPPDTGGQVRADPMPATGFQPLLLSTARRLDEAVVYLATYRADPQLAARESTLRGVTAWDLAVQWHMEYALGAFKARGAACADELVPLRSALNGDWIGFLTAGGSRPLQQYELQEYLRLPLLGLDVFPSDDGLGVCRRHTLPSEIARDTESARGLQLRELFLGRKYDIALDVATSFPTVLRSSAYCWGAPPLAMHWAIRNDTSAVVHSDLGSPLVYAIAKSSDLAVQLLLRAVACPNMMSHDGQAQLRTPLYVATLAGSPRTVRLLLAARANPGPSTSALASLMLLAFHRTDFTDQLPAVFAHSARSRLSAEDMQELAATMLPSLLAHGNWPLSSGGGNAEGNSARRHSCLTAVMASPSHKRVKTSKAIRTHAIQVVPANLYGLGPLAAAGDALPGPAGLVRRQAAAVFCWPEHYILLLRPRSAAPTADLGNDALVTLGEILQAHCLAWIHSVDYGRILKAALSAMNHKLVAYAWAQATEQCASLLLMRADPNGPVGEFGTWLPLQRAVVSDFEPGVGMLLRARASVPDACRGANNVMLLAVRAEASRLIALMLRASPCDQVQLACLPALAYTLARDRGADMATLLACRASPTQPLGCPPTAASNCLEVCADRPFSKCTQVVCSLGLLALPATMALVPMTTLGGTCLGLAPPTSSKEDVIDILEQVYHLCGSGFEVMPGRNTESGRVDVLHLVRQASSSERDMVRRDLDSFLSRSHYLNAQRLLETYPFLGTELSVGSDLPWQAGDRPHASSAAFLAVALGATAIDWLPAGLTAGDTPAQPWALTHFDDQGGY